MFVIRERIYAHPVCHTCAGNIVVVFKIKKHWQCESFL